MLNLMEKPLNVAEIKLSGMNHNVVNEQEDSLEHRCRQKLMMLQEEIDQLLYELTHSLRS